MNKRGSRLIMGTAIGVAAIAVTIDHTRHRLPEPQAKSPQQSSVIIIEEEDDSSATPCGLGDSNSNPCSLGQGSPCSL